MNDSKIKQWKTLKSEVAFDQKWMPILQEAVELPDGSVIDDYFMWEEGAIVMVVPVLDDGRLVMVRQYRHGAQKTSLEFPAGWVDKGETLESAIKRELTEETGYKVDTLEKMLEVHPAPGKVRGVTHIYKAEVNQTQREQVLEITENIEVVLVEQDQVPDLILTGVITDTRTISAMYYFEKKK